MFKTATMVLFLLVIFNADLSAQYFQCPAGSTQVSGGGGIMCQCSDGSYASMAGCAGAATSAPSDSCAELQREKQMLLNQWNAARGNFAANPYGGAESNWQTMMARLQQLNAAIANCGSDISQRPPTQQQTEFPVNCGTHSCRAGSSCGSRNTCLPNGSNDCGNGQSCPGNKKCSRSGEKCLPQDTVDCGAFFCNAGSKCGSGNNCLAQNAVDCGGGRSCSAGTLCVRGGAECLTSQELTERAAAEKQKKEDEIAERKRQLEAKKEAERKRIEEQQEAARRKEEERKQDIARRNEEQQRLLAEKKKQNEEARQLAKKKQEEEAARKLANMQAKQKAELEAKQKAEETKRLAAEAEAKRKTDAIAAAKAAKQQRVAKQCATAIEIIDAIAVGKQPLPECKGGSNAMSVQTGSPSSAVPQNGVVLNPNLKDIQSLPQLPAQVPAAQQSAPPALPGSPLGCSTFSNPTPCPRAGPASPNTPTNTGASNPPDLKEEKQTNPFSRQPTQDELAKDAADERKKAAAAPIRYPVIETEDDCGGIFTSSPRKLECSLQGGGIYCMRKTTTKYCEKGLFARNVNCTTPETTTEAICKK